MFMCVGRSVVRRVRLFATLWTVTHQAPLSRQEYWSGLPFPSPGDLPTQGSNPRLALAGGFFTTKPPARFFLKFELKFGRVAYE